MKRCLGSAGLADRHNAATDQEQGIERFPPVAFRSEEQPQGFAPSGGLRIRGRAERRSKNRRPLEDRWQKHHRVRQEHPVGSRPGRGCPPLCRGISASVRSVMSVVLPLPQDLASRVHSCPLRRGGNRFRKMEDHGHHGPHGRRVLAPQCASREDANRAKQAARRMRVVNRMTAAATPRDLRACRYSVPLDAS